MRDLYAKCRVLTPDGAGGGGGGGGGGFASDSPRVIFKGVSGRSNRRLCDSLSVRSAKVCMMLECAVRSS